ncbi:hypothetical protein [Falsiroseomonas sp. HC035]|uniref:hypothetical protein n=1 Tax=unclassified Falsiroseomonas TaxID=2870720 RepID=UPI003D312863
MRTLRPLPPKSTQRFTHPSDLRFMVVRMIAMNSLAAFTAEVSRTQGAAKTRGSSASPQPLQPLPAPQQRTLDTMPAMPGGPVPRGSLLDLRV